MGRQVELLSPAGSYESLKAAITAGADAVYVGGLQFGARAYAGNLDEETLCKAIDYVHLHGSKLYMTVNTLLKDQELAQLTEYLRPYYRQGLDGVIIQDLGVWMLLREEFPDLQLHVSTQMTLMGAPGAALLKELGASRIVPARELSLEEIREIKQKVDIEIETFVHGALCYCYSGQCLFSSMLGGRSGNRGRCAQPCRLPYQVYEKERDREHLLSKKGEEYLLSLKDLCTIEHIPDLIEAGIDSFKIEGRMKRPEYTAGVTSIYRKYIDRYLERGRTGFQVEKQDQELLLALYNRDGFTTGYYNQKNGRGMVSLVRPNHFEEGTSRRSYEELLFQLKQRFLDQEKREKIQGNLKLSKESPNILRIKLGETEVQAEGEPAKEPINQPMSLEQIKSAIEKTGNTPFVWEKLDVEMDGPVFIPVKNLKELRRNGLAALEDKLCELYHRETDIKKFEIKDIAGEKENKQIPVIPELRVQIDEPWMLETVLKTSGVDAVYVDAEGFFEDGRIPWEAAGELVKDCKKAGKDCYLVLPELFRKEQAELYARQYPLLLQADFHGILVQNLEEVQFLRERKYEGSWLTDGKLYTMNQKARQMFLEMGAKGTTLPYELNAQELLHLGCTNDEMVVYGYQPLMVTANCLAKTLKNCHKKPGVLWLKDRYQKYFPVKRRCRSCHNVIYNSAPLYLLDRAKELEKLHLGSMRLHFTIEDKMQLQTVLLEAVRTLKKGEAPNPFEGEFTRGHFKRGVE